MSFGTSFNDSRAATIKAVEDAMDKAFDGYDVAVLPSLVTPWVALTMPSATLAKSSSEVSRGPEQPR